MKTFLNLSLAAIVISTALANQEYTVGYFDLQKIQTQVMVQQVMAENVTKSPEGGGEAVKLSVVGGSACGKSFLVDHRDGTLKFYQIGPTYTHIEPYCRETIEYFWSPADYSLKIGDSKTFTLSVGDLFYVSVSGTRTKNGGFTYLDPVVVDKATREANLRESL